MTDMSKAELAALEVEANEAKRKSQVAPLIPLILNENVKLQATTPQTIRRNLEGRGTQDGPVTGMTWTLIHYDSTAAIYHAECPYPFCHGKGTLEAMAILDKRGKVDLPFAAPGGLCCDMCDEEISKLYDIEAAKMKAPRRRLAKITQQPLVTPQ